MIAYMQHRHALVCTSRLYFPCNDMTHLTVRTQFCSQLPGLFRRLNLFQDIAQLSALKWIIFWQQFYSVALGNILKIRQRVVIEYVWHFWSRVTTGRLGGILSCESYANQSYTGYNYSIWYIYRSRTMWRIWYLLQDASQQHSTCDVWTRPISGSVSCHTTPLCMRHCICNSRKM